MSEKELNSEKLAPQLLLKRGVKVPVPAPLFLRLFGKKTISLTLQHPSARTLLKIADKFLAAGIEAEEETPLHRAVKHYANHSKTVARIVALGFLNSPYKNWLNPFLGRWLSNRLDAQYFHYLYHLLIVHGGVEDFMSTIRLIGKTRITRPMNLSPEEKTS